MSENSIYHLENGKCYMLVEEESVGREKQNLKLAIKLAKEKTIKIQKRMNSLDEGSTEYDELQDDLNDHELLISDFEDRFEDLLRIPV
ncbi:MAG: hypothetical protein L3J98_02980 [Gammaproteobacteria bacterium]|nr:hypothetical protein [Gammaproteobacteria bacterium]